jgi:hypothetical protein
MDELEIFTKLHNQKQERINLIASALSGSTECTMAEIESKGFRAANGNLLRNLPDGSEESVRANFDRISNKYIYEYSKDGKNYKHFTNPEELKKFLNVEG